MTDPFWTAVSLTVLAGLATVVGGVLGVLGRPLGRRTLSAALGLAAGVMTAVSLLELLPSATIRLAAAFGGAGAVGATAAAAAVGAGLYALLARALSGPARLSPTSPTSPTSDVAAAHARPGRGGDALSGEAARMRRLGIVTAVAIGLHNVPEGFATFAGTLEGGHVGLAVAAAMAVHNVPEGIAVAVPVRQATGSRLQALAWAAGAGVAEPVGALLLALALAPVLSPALLGGVLAGVAGVMLTLSLAALLPTARRAGGLTTTLFGAAGGAAVTVASMSALT